MKTTKYLMMALAGLWLFSACKGPGSYEVVNNSSADSAMTQADSVTEPKLVKTAAMQFKVKDVKQSSESISSITKELGGMVIHHELHSRKVNDNDLKIGGDSIERISAYNLSADMTVKVPTVKLEDFMNKVHNLSMLMDERMMDIEDKSWEYMSAQLKLKSRSEIVAQQKKGKVTIKDPTKVLALKDDMIDQQITNKIIDDAVKYSTINLSFYQNNVIGRERIVNDNVGEYKLSFTTRVSLAFANGWNIFKDVIVGVAHFWAIILFGLLAWFVIRYYRGRSGLSFIKLK